MGGKSVFERELQDLINKHSMENGSDTPDFILAHFLVECLIVFDAAVNVRAEWYNATDDTTASADEVKEVATS